MNTQSIRRTLCTAAMLVGGLASPASPVAAAADIDPRQVSEYREDFPGVSAKGAEARLAAQEKGTESGMVEGLERRLGEQRYAGVWFDNASGEFVVPLLPAASRGAVHAELASAGLGAEYRTAPATHSWEELEEAHERIDAELLALIEQGLAQTSLDPRANAVLIRLASGADGVQRGQAERAAAAEAVRVELREAKAEQLGAERDSCSNEARSCGYPLRGGVVMSGGCTAGFKAIGNTFGNRFMLTAGHCAKTWPNFHAWDANDPGPGGYTEKKIGPTAANDYPASDWAAINANGSEWDGSPWPSQVAVWGIDHQRSITHESGNYIGLYACRSGKTTGTSCGYVTGLDETVGFEDGTTYHLVRYSPICSDGGDSGGPVLSGNTALGIHVGSGGSTECQKVGYYHEITEAAEQLGVTIGTKAGTHPHAVTGDPTNVQARQATWHGSVDANGLSTTFRFEYGPTTGYGQSTSNASAGSGWRPAAVSQNVTLQPATTYHYRLRAANTAGTSYGADEQFTTPTAAPLAVTEGTSDVKAGNANLHGKVEAGGLATTYRFEWGTTTSYGNSTQSTSAGSGTSYVSANGAITGQQLKGLTTYHYRLRAENSKGTTYGADKSFTTPDWRPGVSAVSNSSPYVEKSSGKVDVSGKVDPKGFATTYRFEWGTQKEFEEGKYGNSVPAPDGSAGAGEGDVEIAETIEGLKGLTKYHYRLVAENIEGVSASDSESFVTPYWKPENLLMPARDTSHTEATLAARIVPRGFTTKYRFEWGQTTAYGNSVPVPDGEIDGEAEEAEVTHTLKGLQPNTIYHYRLISESSQGKGSFGEEEEKDQTFISSPSGFAVGQYPGIFQATASGVLRVRNLPIAGEELSCSSPPGFSMSADGPVETLVSESFSGSGPCYFSDGTKSDFLAFNECDLEIDPSFAEGEFTGEVAIGPPGCGHLTAEWVAGLELWIYPVEGIEATIESTGEGEGSAFEVSLHTEELKYSLALPGNPDKTIHEGGELSASYLIGATGEEGEPRGAYVTKGFASESDEHVPRFEAEAYTANLAGSGTLELITDDNSLACASSGFLAPLTGPTAQLNLDVEAAGCLADGELPADAHLNSCHLTVEALNAGPPYEGTLGIACAEEGDAIEFKVYAGEAKEFLLCTIEVGPQADLQGLELTNVGNAPERAVALEGQAEGVVWSQGGLCGAKSGEGGTLGAEVTLGGKDDAGEQVGAYLTGEELLGFSLVGHESESESSQPRFEADGYPEQIGGEGPLSLGTTEGSTECAESSLEGEVPAPSAQLDLDVEAAGCLAGGELPADAHLNSCRLTVDALNAGPPYEGTLGIACAEEGDAIEFKVYAGEAKEFLVCTIEVGPQAGLQGLELTNVGKAPERAVALEGQAEGVVWSQGGLCGAKSGEGGTLEAEVALGIAD